MVRNRTKKAADSEGAVARDPWREGMDVNAIVSYNLKAIREKRGMTQENVAAGLARLTGHRLPQASISAMERSYENIRRKRFDAHELYLLSQVFSVPVLYFFLPPPGTGTGLLADSHRPIEELYVSVIGWEYQLTEIDERLKELGMTSPEEVDRIAAAIYGSEEAATRNWHDHFRTWRKKRIAELTRTYDDQLREVAEMLAKFANGITQLGPAGYLQSLAHRPEEEVDVSLLEER